MIPVITSQYAIGLLACGWLAISTPAIIQEEYQVHDHGYVSTGDYKQIPFDRDYHGNYYEVYIPQKNDSATFVYINKKDGHIVAWETINKKSGVHNYWEEKQISIPFDEAVNQIEDPVLKKTVIKWQERVQKNPSKVVEDLGKKAR